MTSMRTRPGMRTGAPLRLKPRAWCRDTPPSIVAAGLGPARAAEPAAGVAQQAARPVQKARKQACTN